MKQLLNVRGAVCWSAVGMLVLTVFLSAGAIEQSYKLAQLQDRSNDMTKQSQVLREKLASAQSLQVVRGYAQARGFVARGPEANALSVSLAAAASALAQQ